MSRSRRRTPISGITTAKSEQWDKRACNKVIRLRVKKLLRGDNEAYLDPLANECRNIWSMAKDGKYYWSRKKFARFLWYAKMMRK